MQRTGRGILSGLPNLVLAKSIVDLWHFSSSPYFLNGLRLDIRYVSSWLKAMLLVVANWRKGRVMLSGLSNLALALTFSTYVSSLLARIF